MPTIDWPDALVPQTCQLALRKAGQQFSSPFNGTTQALDFVAERWVLSVSLAQMAARNPRGVGSFCNRLAGGVERVRGWNFGHNRGLPRGTMRGLPVLSSSAVRGDSLVIISGATAWPNLLAGGGFENDANADGIADFWTAYSAGACVSPSWNTSSTADTGALAQRVQADSLGTSNTDRVGVSRLVSGIVPGLVYSVSAAFRWGSTSTANHCFFIDWKDAGGTNILSSVDYGSALTLAFSRRSATFTAPAGAVSASFYVFVHSRLVSGAADVLIDSVQFEAAAVATDFAGVPTLLQDDMIGVGGQLFQVGADTALTDGGAGGVPVVNRVRAAISSGSAVLWSRPTAEFILPAMQAGPVYRPGAIESAALDLVEVWG